MKIPKISKAEMEVMQVIWSLHEETTAGVVEVRLGSKWKPTTVLTLLKRLADKNVLSVRKDGKVNYYVPLITEEQYRQSQTESFLESIHGGSVKSLVVSLYDGKKLSQEEIEELRRWLDKV